jgi:ABC-type sugar transport system ATPase subunit
VPEDRKRDGLMMQMSVADNASLGRFARFGFINDAEESSALDPIFRSLSVKNAARVSALSGGNQQKVLLTRCLLANPEVLFLDDPTRGIDVGAKQEIYSMIERLASEGKGIILVSSELPELLRCCDRILVMREGRTTATLDASDATQERIMKAATL